jgi:hypothetical protein
MLFHNVYVLAVPVASATSRFLSSALKLIGVRRDDVQDSCVIDRFKDAVVEHMKAATARMASKMRRSRISVCSVDDDDDVTVDTSTPTPSRSVSPKPSVVVRSTTCTMCSLHLMLR